MFHVGQKVVCVDDVWIHPSWLKLPSKPVLRGHYTIRGLQREEHFSGLLLEEIVNPPLWWVVFGVREMSFPTFRFRPIVERKTDISIFTAMLTPQGVDA